MAGFGRAPKPDGQRRNRSAILAQQGSTRLPAAGRDGEPPEWPIGRPNARERTLWARLWHTPQAVAWETLGWTDVVARYARLLTAAEARDAPIGVLSEVRQLEDRLGLSPMAMLRLRWFVGEVEEAPVVTDDNVVDIRRRVQAID